ncbi:MAG TPA: nucleoside diphosphate kinase regulator [Anaerolineales bacterium]|nr:nucleoside diphosphate kinase regulator [Anaerolineales bacterium]
MNQPSIFITTKDAQKLRKLIREAFHSEYRGSDYLKKLAEEMEKAFVVNPDQIPADVITLNSTARLVDQETQEEMVYTLVFPEDANVSQGKISILAPIGTAMLGYKVGDTFEWDTPGGKRTLRVKEILYQPEASGDEQ